MTQKYNKNCHLLPLTAGDGCTVSLMTQLFDFDMEVKPVLEVLVGKTLEQSLLEVLEEEELADLRQQQRMYEELRNAELAEQQRLEEQDRRLVQAKVTVFFSAETCIS